MNQHNGPHQLLANAVLQMRCKATFTTSLTTFMIMILFLLLRLQVVHRMGRHFGFQAFNVVPSTEVRTQAAPVACCAVETPWRTPC